MEPWFARSCAPPQRFPPVAAPPLVTFALITPLHVYEQNLAPNLRMVEEVQEAFNCIRSKTLADAVFLSSMRDRHTWLPSHGNRTGEWVVATRTRGQEVIHVGLQRRGSFTRVRGHPTCG